MYETNSPVALIVLGMHRSGTSALARVCNLLGAYLPPEILGATPANETGHWEPSGMVAANMKAFEAVDFTWDSVEAFPQTWFDSAGTTSAERVGAAFLKNSFEWQKLFLLKDPRACRTLPIWLRRLFHYKAHPVVALIVRNPLEVAASLKLRDGLPLQHALLLWLRYNIEAELHSREAPRVVASYDDLLRDWESLANKIAAIGDFAWPANMHRAREQIADFLRREHRHQTVEDEAALVRPEVAALVRETYAALLQLRDPDASELAKARLDEVRRQLDAADSIFSGAVADLSMAVRRSAAAAAEASALADAEVEARAAAEARAVAHEAEAQARIDAANAEAQARVAAASADAEARVDAANAETQARVAAASAEAEARVAAANTEADARMAAASLAERARSLAASVEADARVAAANAEAEAKLAVAAEANARGAARAAALRSVVARAFTDSERLAVLQARTKVVARQMRGAGRLALFAAMARCLIASALDFVARPRLALELLRHPRRGLARMRGRHLVRRSGLFDAAYYLENSPDVRAAGADPLVHFIDYGWRERRRPSPEFDTALYLQEQPEVELAGQNPLLHLLYTSRARPDAAALAYVETNAALAGRLQVERRLIETSGLFDAEYYLREIGGAIESDPVTHYCRIGWKQKRSVGPKFDAPWYVSNYSDVETAGLNPLLHYITHGAAEGRRPSAMAPTGGGVRRDAHGGFAAGLAVAAAPLASPAPALDDPVRMVTMPGDLPYRAGAKTIVLCAHVAGRALFGGERSFLDMADGLNANGFNVVITTPHGDGAYLAELRRRCLYVRVFDYGWWRDRQAVNPAAINAFTKVLLEARADALHANTIMLREGPLAARRLGVPVVIHVRELVTEDEQLCRLIGETPQAIVDHVCAAADFIAANSAAAAHLFAKPDASFVVPNVTDFETLNIPNLVDAKAVIFGMISSNVAKKGIADVVELAELCLDRAPNARFLIVGPDSPDLKAMQASRGGKLPRNVSLVGYQETPREAISKVNVILNFSHFAESFGRTVLEGFAARRPTIGYDWGALPELVTHEETGFLVPHRDVAAAADYVQRLAADPQLILRLGEAGRQRCLERYSPPAYSKAMGRLYAEVFARMPAPAPLATLPSAPDDPALIRSIVKPARNLPASTAAQSKPRIGYFVWHFPVPSETFILNELRILVAEGYDVRVFCRQIPHPNFKPDFPIEWERVATPADLARRLKETGRDIAHGHFAYPVVTDFLWPACQEAGIQFTFTAHAQDIFRYANDEKNRIGEIVQSEACRRVFVLSRFHHDYLKQRGAPPGKIVINGNGIDPTSFAGAAALNRSARSFRKICAVHRFTAKKGLEHLIRAGKLLAADGIEIDIFGYGELAKDYQTIIAAEGVANVRLLGAVETREELLDVFRRYDLFVAPCVRALDGDMDGIPTVLMEAMAAGLPVLATPIAGIPDLVQDGVTGLLCEPDPQSITEAIRRYYAMPAQRVEALIEHGRRHVEEHYDIRRLVGVLKRVWRNDLIDLVIVSYNNPDELREVIRRLYAMTSLPFHLTICDNASHPDLAAYLDELHASMGNVTLIHNGYNSMVGPGTNRALEAGSADCAIYVCGKEGFALSPGWEIPFVHALDADEKVGVAGSLCHSPTYLRGADYPTGVSLFPKFRNQDFATRNPARVFKHVQGGLFALRRKMVEDVGGFSQAAPHSLTDVEYSYYAESRGWRLGEAPHILALYNKTRPGIEAHLDEQVRAIHPPRLGDLAWLDEIAGGKIAFCNLCAWRGPKFSGGDGAEACPACGALPADRSFYRWLARSILPHRRLAALGVNVPKPLQAIWRLHFQGALLDGADFFERLHRKGRLENRDAALGFVFFRDLSEGAQTSAALKEAARLLGPDGVLVTQTSGGRAALLDIAASAGFALSEEPLYRSVAARYDWRRMYVFEKATRTAKLG